MPNGTVHSGCADPTFGYCVFFCNQDTKERYWAVDTDLQIRGDRVGRSCRP